MTSIEMILILTWLTTCTALAIYTSLDERYDAGPSPPSRVPNSARASKVLATRSTHVGEFGSRPAMARVNL